MSPDGRAASSHPTPFECSEALLRVFEYLDGEMGPDDVSRVRAHLDACAECFRQYDLDQMVKMVVKRSCSQQAAPTQLRSTILTKLTMIRIESE
ncbi:MAG TPA: mycothiol system anti-sigma-R factor [Dermatophilaceae bacterium]|nr:mycothiol system anti-sigma-R factor [Dermatophilaceae bacterium]